MLGAGSARIARSRKTEAPELLVSTCRTARYLQGASPGVIPAEAGIQIGSMGSRSPIEAFGDRLRGSDERLRGLAHAQE